MKKITFVLLRHGKNVPALGATLASEELERAKQVGYNLEASNLLSDYVTAIGYSPLPRAIQTAFAVSLGMQEASIEMLLPANPAFGNDEMFKTLTAPEAFRTRAKEVGNFRAALELHGKEVVDGWATGILGGLGSYFGAVPDEEVCLVSFHSPCVEMAVHAMNGFTADGLDEKYLVMNELDAVVVTASQENEGDQITYEVVGKIPAPALETATA